MKKIVIQIMLLCFSTFTFAQNSGEIKGKVFDSKTKEALTGATVYVEYMGTKIANFVDKNGQFTLKPLNPGTYNLTITFTGYDTATFADITVYADKITFIDNSYLDFGVLEKKEVVISAKKIIDPENTSKIDIGHAQIADMPDKENVSSIIRCFFTDVKVSDNGEELYFRGSRNGDAVYYVDGVKLMDNKLHVSGNSINSITVYTGGVPAKYGDFTGGVVIIETQSYFS